MACISVFGKWHKKKYYSTFNITTGLTNKQGAIMQSGKFNKFFEENYRL